MSEPTASRYVAYMPLAEIVTATRNPKTHDEAGIKASLDHFGMAELPLLDDRTGRLVAGHGRYEQLRALEAAGRRVPDGVQVGEDGAWLVPVIRGWRSRTDDDAQAYLIASNKLSENGGWDDRDLLESLGDLADGVLLELSGFTADDVDDLAALFDLGAWDDHKKPAAKKSTGGSEYDEDDLDDDGDADQDEDGDDDAGHTDEDDRDMWPRIDVRVRPDVFDAWRLLVEEHEGKDDAERIEVMLRHHGHLA